MKNPYLLKNCIPLLYLLMLFTLLGCQKNNTSNDQNVYLELSEISFKETSRSQSLDPPNGGYQPDNPNFSITDPSTWTGNMAQYVLTHISYSVSFNVYNSGTGVARNVEVDLYLKDESGYESVKTVSMGAIDPGRHLSTSAYHLSQNDELKSCSGEVFWGDL